jgi:hypothetical protein
MMNVGVKSPVSAGVKSPMAEMFEMSDLERKNTSDSTASAAPMFSSNMVGSEDDIFFDTINVQFHFGTFVRQLLAHLFLPLFPLIINKHGQINRSIYSILGSWVSPVLIYLMILSYIMIPTADHNPAMHGGYIIPLVYFLQHRLVISIKYGSLSRTEYHKFMTCEDDDLCANYLNQMQLFQGWFDLNPLVVRFELAAASARIGARINEIDILIDNPNNSASAQNQLRAWNAFMRGHQVIDYTSPPCRQLRRRPDGSYALSVYDYCEALLMHSTRSTGNEQYFGWFTEFFSWTNLLIPYALLAYYENSMKYDHAEYEFWAVLFLLCSTAINFLYAKLFYVLLYIAVTDVLRQKSIFNDLNSMARLTDIMVSAELSAAHAEVTPEEKRDCEIRVAEILSIKPSVAPPISQYTKVVLEMSDTDMDRDTLASIMAEGMPASAPKPTVAGVAAASPMSPRTQPSAQTQAEPPSGCAEGDCGAKRTSVLGERLYKDNEYHLLPRINFTESHNVVAWTHARLTMQHFGERFHFRLEMYVVAAIAMLLAMMVLGLMNLGVAHDRLSVFFTPWFLQTLLSVSMCIVFLALITQAGTCVNEALVAHSQTMCSHALRLNRKLEKVQQRLLVETNEVIIEKLQNKAEVLSDAIDKVDAMRDVIDTNTELKPFKIFGFTAESSLTMTIITTAVSFYGILVSLLSNTEANALAAVGGA